MTRDSSAPIVAAGDRVGRAAKLKAVRRAAMAATGSAPRGQLLIDRSHGAIRDVNQVTAVHAKGTFRERYKKLKKLFGISPEVRAQVNAQDSYQRMLREERERGGPLFDRGGNDGEDHS